MDTAVLVKVQVTPEDVQRGVPADPCYCPIAWALKRAGYGSPYVEDEGVEFYSDEKRYWADLPLVAAKAVDDFDTSGYMEPFEFELSAIEREAA